MIKSFVFINSVRGETDKNMHSMHDGFHTERGRWDILSYFKREDFSVSYLN